MDRISYLPINILHDILSRLPEKDAVRTCILSKSWEHILSSFPILVFDESRFGIPDFPDPDRNNSQQMDDFTRKRKDFVDYVDATMLRFSEHSLSIKQFKLIVGSFDYDHMYPLFSHWMKLARESGVEVLGLCLSDSDQINVHGRYCLPLPTSILETKSLIELTLHGAFKFDQELMSHPIQFVLLQVLSLDYVCFKDESVFQNLISSCPFIECMNLISCEGLKFITIRGLPKLKILNTYELEDIIVETPSLEEFRYKTKEPCLSSVLNVDKCTNLRNLSLCQLVFRVTDQWLLKFPLLESLELIRVHVSQKLKISSIHLKILKLDHCLNLKEVCIDAPNLYSCDYNSDNWTMPVLSFLSCSSQLEVNVHFYIYRPLNIHKLGEIHQNVKPGNVLSALVLTIWKMSSEFDMSLLRVPDIPVPPPSIRHLKLKLAPWDNENICFPVTVFVLLWCCRPTNISMELNKTCSRTLAKVLCEKLVGRVDCCCSSRTTDFWLSLCSSCQIKLMWPGLKDVHITSSSWKDGNVVDCKTFLDALPTLPPGEKICFRLELSSYI